MLIIGVSCSNSTAKAATAGLFRVFRCVSDTASRSCFTLILSLSISFPFFFDPNFAAEVRPIPGPAAVDDRAERWDRASVHDFQGTYGEYLLAKVARVFPGLDGAVRR